MKMRCRIFLVLTFLVSVGPASVVVAQDHIGNELGPKAYKSLKQQVGGLRGSYLYKNGLVIDQIDAAWSIPGPTVQLEDGNYLISGCRQHYCPEKSAAIVRANGTVIAAGLINFRCVFDRHRDDDCLGKPRLTIFVQAANDDPAKLKPLYDWARSQPPLTEIGRVEMFEKVILPTRS